MPLPGDPDAVLAASGRLRSGAGALQSARDAVVARGHAMSSWTGRAATEALATIESNARNLERAVDAASQAAGPLARYADELRAAQQDYVRGEQMMLDGQAALAATGSAAVAAADLARDAAQRSMDDAGALMTLAEERALRANEAAARVLADAASLLPDAIPPSVTAPVVGSTGPNAGQFFADIGNSLASLGNAALHDPGAVGAMALGAGAIVVGAGGEIGGIALDVTGVGAVVGVPAGVVSAGVIATGVATVSAGAMTVAQSAPGFDHTEPFRPDRSDDGPPAAAKRPDVSDPKLGNIVDSLYRGTSSETRTGSGTTADAVRYERTSGNSVGHKLHTEKANNSVRALRSWLRRNPQASAADRQVAQQEYDDLLDALGRGR
jgi:hypothetical protein